MRTLTILAAAGAMSAFAFGATAQEVDAAIDTDASGNYSVEELTVVYPDMTPETFTSLDANADGSVDAAELQAAIDAGTLTAPAQ